MGDYPMWLYVAYNTKTYFIDKPTGVYRLLKNSASHHPDAQKLADFELSAYDIRFFFAKQFHHEYMLPLLASNLVGKLQDLSIQYDKRIEYDFAEIKREYGLNNSMKLQVLDYILKHDFLRHQYIKYLKLRMGDNQKKE